MASVRYLVSTLTGRVRCTDATVVVFVPYSDGDDGAMVPARPKPQGPKPTAAHALVE